MKRNKRKQTRNEEQYKKRISKWRQSEEKRNKIKKQANEEE